MLIAALSIMIVPKTKSGVSDLRQEILINQTRGGVRPCRVGKALHVEVAQAQFCYPLQRSEQLCILLACRRKRSCCVGKTLYVEVA